MAEYIERESAVNSISKLMPDLTTPDGTGQFDEEIFKAQELIVDCMETIHKIPTVDVVEVVRCKDCEKWDTSNKFLNTCACSRWSQSKSAPRLTKPDDFCSYGERKEGG